MNKRAGKRGAIEWDTLIPWMIGALVLILAVVVFIAMNDTMREKAMAFAELWGFGRG